MSAHFIQIDIHTTCNLAIISNNRNWVYFTLEEDFHLPLWSAVLRFVSLPNAARYNCLHWEFIFLVFATCFILFLGHFSFSWMVSFLMGWYHLLERDLWNAQDYPVDSINVSFGSPRVDRSKYQYICLCNICLLRDDFTSAAD